MAGAVKGRGDEAPVTEAVASGLVALRDGVEPLQDLSDEPEAWDELLGGVCGLDLGGHDGDVDALGDDVLLGGQAAYEYVVLAAALRPGDDDLA